MRMGYCFVVKKALSLSLSPLSPSLSLSLSQTHNPRLRTEWTLIAPPGRNLITALKCTIWHKGFVQDTGKIVEHKEIMACIFLEQRCICKQWYRKGRLMFFLVLGMILFHLCAPSLGVDTTASNTTKME